MIIALYFVCLSTFAKTFSSENSIIEITNDWGEKTGEIKVCVVANGYFSNSATTNSCAKLQINIMEEYCWFDLYEHCGNHASKDNFEIRFIGEDNGESYYFTESQFNDIYNKTDFLELCKENNIIKIKLREITKYYPTTAEFKIYNCKDLYKKYIKTFNKSYKFNIENDLVYRDNKFICGNLPGDIITTISVKKYNEKLGSYITENIYLDYIITSFELNKVGKYKIKIENLYCKNEYFVNVLDKNKCQYKQVNDTIKISNLTPNFLNVIELVYNDKDTTFLFSLEKEYNLNLDKIGKYEITIHTKHQHTLDSVIYIHETIEPLKLLHSNFQNLPINKIAHNFTLHPNIKEYKDIYLKIKKSITISNLTKDYPNVIYIKYNDENQTRYETKSESIVIPTRKMGKYEITIYSKYHTVKKTIYNYNKEEKEENHNSNLTTKNPHQLVEKFYNIKKQIKSNKKLAKQLVKNSTEYNQMLSNIEKLKAEQKDIEQKYYEITNYSIYQHDKYLQTH